MRSVSTGLAAAIAIVLGGYSTVHAQAQSTPPEDSLFGVEEIIVTGTAVAERTKFESSVAISTFSAADIAQQAPASAAELISAVPGFWVESTAGSTQGNVFARGIIQDGGYRYVGLMEDGIPIYPVFELSFYNPDQFVRVDEMIDRVEALRGGTAPIFTAGAVGGVINFVTRTAGQEPEGIAKVGFTDYGSYRADGAWSAPLNESWGVAVGGYYRASDGIRDPGYTADEGGQVRFNVSGKFEAAEIELFGKYINDRSLFAVPIPLQGNPSDPDAVNGQDALSYSLHSEDLARAGLPISASEVRLQGSELEDGIHPALWTIGGRVRMDITDTISFNNVLRYTDGTVRFDGIFPGPAPVTGAAYATSRGVAPAYTLLATGESYAANQLVQFHGHWAVNKEFAAIQDDIRVTFDLGANNLTVGAYVADYGMKDRWTLGNEILMDVRSQPRRLLLPGATDPNGFVSYSSFNLLTDYDGFTYSAYVSDEWSVTDALRLDFGVRYDSQDIEGTLREGTQRDLDANPLTRWNNSTSLVGNALRRVDEDFDNTAYSIGFNYEFTDQHAVFGHYTDSAKLPHFDDVRNGVLQKDSVENIELGYKTSLSNFVAFVTLFQTEFDNVPFSDILPNGTPVIRRAGTRTRGVEIEGQFEPLDIFSIGFSMTFQQPEYTQFSGSVLDNTGNTIRRIPERLGRLTPTLRFLDERLRVYLTYQYIGERFSNDENTIALPKYTKLDGGVTFEVTDAISVQLTGDNLTNEIGLTEGNPRTDLGATGIGALYMARPLFERSFTIAGTVKF
ncbi:MAG TPA: TonB-dependent receptor [Steroidobacteraceae bacterium]|nr:TonB-dependent receptor [Steroidobacteraceae bacterium]